ncbi:MAG: S41 family peptidase [Chloroflexi bacterium]|nr:S41 family peptidase [Chloroflexota bacterium]
MSRLRPPTRLSSIALTSIVAVLAFGLAFVSGYLFGRFEPGGPLAVLDNLQPSTARATEEAVLSSDEQQRFRLFWETWQIVEKEFYDKGQIDHQKMMYGAVKGMVEAVGDPYTIYMTPAQRDVNETDLRGSFDGVGVQVDLRDGKLTVVAPIDDTPAAKAGMRTGDIIVQVDGKSLNGKSLNDAVELIRGQRGTDVTLTVARLGVADPLTFTMTRAEIKMKSVRTRLLDHQVGYVRISTFSASTGSEMATAMQDLMAQQPHGVVIDLRANPGGYLHTAVETAGQFLTSGSVVLYQVSGDGSRKIYKTDSAGAATDAKLVVLVNKGTASASEILAGALRDNGRAILIGEQTFGKGTVQNVHQLSDKSGLRVTTAQWLTPNEQRLQGVGLTPDRIVALPADTPATTDPTVQTDPQVDAAIQYILAS